MKRAGYANISPTLRISVGLNFNKVQSFLYRSRLLESEAMASAVARRSVMTASRMGRASVEAPTESILEIAKQDLNSQMKKAKVGYGFRHRSSNYSYDTSDYSYSYNVNLAGSFSFRENNPALDTRTTRASRVTYPRNSFRVENRVGNPRESRTSFDRFKPVKRSAKGPAPRCHGKGFKRESLLKRGINKVKKSLFGLKVVPRRLSVKKSPAKKCLNAYGFGARTKLPLTSTNMPSTSQMGARNSISKIPIPVSGFSRRQHLRSFLMDNGGYPSTTMTSLGQYGAMRSNQGSSGSIMVGQKDKSFLRAQDTDLSGSWSKNPPEGNIDRRYSNPGVFSSYGKHQSRNSGLLWNECGVPGRRGTNYPNRNSTGTFGAYLAESENFPNPGYDDVIFKGARNDSWDSFDGQRAVHPQPSRSSQNRKKQNISPSLITLNPRTSRELSVVDVDSPMSSRGSWEGYECEHDVTSENARPSSEHLRPISENVLVSRENHRPLPENRRLPSKHEVENVRPVSLELDEKALSLPERRSRLEKDLDALMESMEKVLGSPVSVPPVREYNPGTWPKKLTREKPKGMPVMFGRPVFEAVI